MCYIIAEVIWQGLILSPGLQLLHFVLNDNCFYASNSKHAVWDLTVTI